MMVMLKIQVVLLVLLGTVTISCNEKKIDVPELPGNACIVCDRISLMEKLKPAIADKYWPGFDNDSLRSPLVYFDDSTSWLAFSETNLFKGKVTAQKMICGGGLSVFRLSKRLDSVPFHMENRMSFTDSTSPVFYNPVMFCSNTEAAKSLVPVVTGTEEWLQMILHEYFHAFQFRHLNTIKYLADSIKTGSDTLDRLYKKNLLFAKLLETENNFLLHALSSISKDSSTFYAREFLVAREYRRKEGNRIISKEIIRIEKFWEKIEGTARYIEYNTGFIFAAGNFKSNLTCDSLFNNFNAYKETDFTKRAWFRKKTKIITAYYYVTGFNLCRLMDKLGIAYKEHLFDRTEYGLEDYLQKAINY